MTSVLVVSNMYPPHHHGGYELSCRDVVDRWRRQGHDVSVLTSDLRVAGAQDVPEMRVWRDLPIGYRDGDLWYPPKHKRPGRERTAQQVFARALDIAKPDVLSIWHMAALSTGLLKTFVATGLPIVYVVCDDWLTYAPKIDPWMKFFEHRPAVGQAVELVTRIPATLPDVGDSGTFLFVSDLTRRRAEEYSPWAYPNCDVTYSGIDRSDFPRLTAPPVRPWRWRLLQADRFDPRKGIETSVRAMAELPAETRLDLLGRGDDAYRAAMLQLAAELGVGDRVSAGTVPRSDMAARYADADVVLFPTEWEEPFGLTPVEAMACGTPVVATGLGGSAEFLVDGVNCLHIEPRDPSAVAAAVRRLADDPALRRRLVAGGLRTADELDVDRLADVLGEWHWAAAERFTGRRPARRPSPVPV
ncbi:MAG TPA: glycosyltransferase [Acidimicrobiales bacterium]|nr:glycosyltransferase [Acidimicrobiales bacterium]